MYIAELKIYWGLTEVFVLERWFVLIINTLEREVTILNLFGMSYNE